MRIIYLLAIIPVITACVAGYQSGEITDRFSDPTGPAIYATRGNAIDYSDPLGVIQVNELNGMVARDRATNKVQYAGFRLTRVSRKNETVFSGEPHWLSVRAGDEAVFLADGERIVLKAITHGKLDHETKRGVGYTIETDYYETVIYRATSQQYYKIAYAQNLEFRFVGTHGIATYPRKGGSLLKSFRDNLQRFYQSDIAPHL